MVQAPSFLPPGRPDETSFVAVFERLVESVGGAVPGEEIALMHRAFEKRTGAFGPDDPWFEGRSRAFWDDALTRGGLAARVRGSLTADDLPWADALPRALRGLFQSREEEDGLVLTCVLSGAELWVTDIDDASRDALGSTAGLFDGTVAARASPVRLALLPGAVFHPESAEGAIGVVVEAARARGLANDAILDALLRMELSLRVLSRVKPSYAYRVEALLL